MLFEQFLKEYVKDLIECSPYEYDIQERDIQDIVNNVMEDEHLHDVLDGCIYNLLEYYEKEGEDNE